MKLKPFETDLVGMWITEGGRVRGDEVCERIEWLTAHHLRKIAVSENWGRVENPLSSRQYFVDIDLAKIQHIRS